MPLILIFVLVLAACQGTQFENDVKKSAVYGASTAGSGDATATAGRDSGQSEGAHPIDPRTVPSPTVVHRATLTCSQKDINLFVQCFTTDAAGKSVHVEPETAYVVYGKGPTWEKTELLISEPGHYSITPSLIVRQGFGVAIVTKNSEYLIDVVNNDSSSMTNLLVDGSFEEVLRGGKVAGTSVSVLPENQTTWKARNKADTGCTNTTPIWEIRVMDNAPAVTKAYAGTRWTELDSSCLNGTPASAGNIALFQTIQIEKEHLYHVSFATMRNQSVASVQTLQVNWGELSPFREETLSNSWQVHRFARAAAETKSIPFEFEEVGISDGSGTYLDRAEVIHFGLPPTILQ